MVKTYQLAELETKMGQIGVELSLRHEDAGCDKHLTRCDCWIAKLWRKTLR